MPTSNTPEKQIEKLIELAEDNQLAVQDAIACLTAEREAFSKERGALMKASAGTADMAETLKRLTAQAIPTIEAAAHQAIQEAMGKLLGMTSQSASQAMGDVAQPILERFSNVVQMADAVEKRVQQTSSRAQRQWLLGWVVGLGSVAALSVASVLYVRSLQADLAAQKTAFAAEVLQMRDTVAALERRGGRIRMDRCGPENRLCFEAASDQGGRDPFRGVWFDANKQKSFVIPKGY